MNESSTKEVVTQLESVSPAPKFSLKSKTTWGMLIILAVAVMRYLGYDVDTGDGKAAELLQTVGAVLAILGIRTAKQPLSLFPVTRERTTNGRVLPTLLLMGMAVGLYGLLPSCSNSLPELSFPEGLKGSVSYHGDKTGGDYGLECDADGCRPKIYVPFVDEAGNVVGEFEVGAGK